MWPNPQFPADLVTITEEILHGKLHFLWSETIDIDMTNSLEEEKRRTAKKMYVHALPFSEGFEIAKSVKIFHWLKVIIFLLFDETFIWQNI